MPITRGFRLLRIASVLIAAFAGFPSESRSQLSRAEFERTNNAFTEAIRLQGQGKHDQAIKLLEETLARVKGLVGPVDESIGAASTRLGQAYFAAGRFEKAEPVLREALKIARALPGEAGVTRISALQGLAATLNKLAKFDESLSLGHATLQEMEARYGLEDERTNAARDTLAQTYLSAKRPLEAIPHGRTCLRYAEARFKPDSPTTIRIRQTLAVALMETGQYPEAKKLFEQSMAIAIEKLKPEDGDRMMTLMGLSKVNQLMGKSADSVDLARKALESVEARPDATPTELITALANLAGSCQITGQYVEAEEQYLRALKLSRAKLGPSDPTTAKILSNYSTMLTMQARFGDAERCVRESLEITAKNPGRESVIHAHGKSNLAQIYVKTGRPAEARLLLEEALRILEAQPEKGHPDIAGVRHNLAALSGLAKDYKASVKQGEEALAELRKQFGGDNHSTAIVMVSLGHSYMYLGEFDKAEAQLKQAVAIMEAERGTATADLASARNALADLYCETRKFAQAEELSRRNVTDGRTLLGQSHPDTAIFLDNLAMTLILQDRRAEAFDELDGSRKSRRDFLLRTLPTLSEGDQFALINQSERLSRDLALLMAVQRRAEPGVAARSAEWVVNGKAITTRALATAEVMARDAKNPEAIRILGDLNAARSRLAQLDQARDEKGNRPATAAGEYDTLARQEKVLAHQLGLAIGSPVVDRWAELAELRASLPADAVFVEFAKVFVTESNYARNPTSPKLARYAAWVIPPAGPGEVALVDLGFAETLDQAVSDALLAIQPPPGRRIRPAEEADAEGTALDALQVLSDRLYKPLRSHLGPARRWVLGLDSALWLVPWAALPVGEGHYAVEDHLIHLVISGRDQLALPPSGESGPPAIFADPDYDLAPGRALAIARERGRVTPGTRGATPRSPTSRPFSIGRNARRLEGFLAEARAIAPLLKEYAGADLEEFLDARASETAFKALRGPKVLVLSTHGFFDASVPVAGEGSPLPGSTTPDPSAEGHRSNPLLRCGLLLAGSNSRLAVPEPGEVDDGILTGLEVVGTDLRGTDLVVLSACETARGDVLAGEGVAGLRQVFQIAGADSVVATLWQVADDESYQLMSAFFQGLARRRGPASALREAQLAMIADRRARFRSAHPFYWSAYALTGFPGPAWRDEAVTAIGSTGLPRLPPPLPRKHRASDVDPPGAQSAISPVTGRRAPSNPWPDGALAVVLLVGGGFLTRWWWYHGTHAWPLSSTPGHAASRSDRFMAK